MINFEDLVENYMLLIEAPTVDPDVFANYWRDSSMFNDVRTLLEKKFKISSSWKDPDQVFPILADAYVRSSAESIIGLAQEGLYPLMDFTWYVTEKTPGTTGDNARKFLTTTASSSGTSITNNKATANGLGTDFVTTCKKLNNEDNPADSLFGYTPASAKATSYIRVVQKKIAQSTIGVLNLKNFDDLSIRKALYGILENRRKVRATVNKNSNIPNAINWVDGILENPQAYSGQIQIPSQIQALYDRVTGEQLVQLSNTFHEFYQAEAAAAQASLSAVDSSGKPLPTETPFMEFITNEPLVANDFVFKFPPTIEGGSPNLAGISGGYLIKNIRLIETPFAKEVITELTNLANHVSEGEPSDIAGAIRGLSRIAKGLSLGVPTMGGR
jgi:hypothetical protein